jgi:hypothetical protein
MKDDIKTPKETAFRKVSEVFVHISLFILQCVSYVAFSQEISSKFY